MKKWGSSPPVPHKKKKETAPLAKNNYWTSKKMAKSPPKFFLGFWKKGKPCPFFTKLPVKFPNFKTKYRKWVKIKKMSQSFHSWSFPPPQQKKLERTGFFFFFGKFPGASPPQKNPFQGWTKAFFQKILFPPFKFPKSKYNHWGFQYKKIPKYGEIGNP